MVDKFRVGVLTQTHGLRGEVKVYPTTDDPELYERVKNVYLQIRGTEIPLKIQHVRYFKQLVIVKFEGIDVIEQIQPYLKGELYVTREDMPALEEGHYYIPDLIGLKVFTDEGEDIGVLDDVMKTGANDVYVVKNGEEEILIPVVEQFVREVDLEEGKVTVHLIEGMRE